MYTKIITIEKKNAPLLDDILNLADKNTYKRLSSNKIMVDYDDDWIIEQLGRNNIQIISNIFSYDK